MSITNASTVARFAVVAMAALALNGCGSAVSGEYSPSGRAHFQSLNFKSNDTAEVMFQGMKSEIRYEVDGDSVKLTNAGETVILTMDDKGCLVGGGPLGTYCKQ